VIQTYMYQEIAVFEIVIKLINLQIVIIYMI